MMRLHQCTQVHAVWNMSKSGWRSLLTHRDHAWMFAAIHGSMRLKVLIWWDRTGRNAVPAESWLSSAAVSFSALAIVSFRSWFSSRRTSRGDRPSVAEHTAQKFHDPEHQMWMRWKKHARQRAKWVEGLLHTTGPSFTNDTASRP